MEKWIPKEKQQRNTSGVYPVISHDENHGLEIEGIDINKGIKRLGGRVESYKNTLKIFLKDGQTKTGEIKACLETEDLPLFTTYVHALKSASANIGADTLSETAGLLEEAGNRKDLSFIKEHIASFLVSLESVLLGIETALAVPETDEKHEAVDVSLLNTKLSKLLEAIDSGNLRNIKEAVKGIEPFSGASDIGGTIEEIINSSSIGEYDEAEVMINKLLQGEQ